MAHWQVYMDGWQLQCCGRAFRVGDEVSWKLELNEGNGWPPGVPASEIAPARIEPAPGDGPHGYELITSGLRAWVPRRPPGDLTEPVRGLLHEDHHIGIPAFVTSTRGIVRRIQLVTCLYGRTADMSWQPLDGKVALSDLDASPRSFAGHELSRDPHPVQTGLLIRLETR